MCGKRYVNCSNLASILDRFLINCEKISVRICFEAKTMFTCTKNGEFQYVLAFRLHANAATGHRKQAFLKTLTTVEIYKYSVL